MKRTVLSVILLLLLCGCALKNTPSLRLKAESVDSVEIKKTCIDPIDAQKRTYVSKTVTGRDDVDKIIAWLESLKLEKHDAIEIPAEQVLYVINLNGTKNHRLIFIEGYVIYDAAAYTYKDPAQQNEIIKKYNLLNYAEQETELDLFK